MQPIPALVGGSLRSYHHTGCFVGIVLLILAFTIRAHVRRGQVG